MNISSVIILLKDISFERSVKNSVCEIKECEIAASENGKIVAVISAQNFDEELEIFKRLEKIDGVAGVSMIYSYQEDLEGDIKRLEESGKLSEILTSETIDARNIIYGGHIGDRVK